MRVVFCGTPEFAVPTLEAILRAGEEVELVVTQPDRPSGRGMELSAPPVKRIAQQHGIPVAQPEKIKNNLEFRAALEAIRPDVIVVVAYGRIIPKWMLDLPPQGNLNLHASLLPKYRGAAPIQWAVAMGESVTGATTMRIDEGLDTGDILLQATLPLTDELTSVEVFPLLAAQGAELMVETLRRLAGDGIEPVKQDGSQATLARILRREDGEIDFRRTARETFHRWRGFQPWPGAYTFLKGKKLMISRMAIADGVAAGTEAGEILVKDGRLLIACAGSWIEAVELQLEGRKRMHAADFLRGNALKSGEKLG